MVKVVGLVVLGGVAGFLAGWVIALFAPNLSLAAIQSAGAVIGAIIGGQAGYRMRAQSGRRDAS
jgi:hypothetical protein